MIETATRLFQEHGYHGVSWRKLVREADAPWGSISHHFPGGKAELAVAAVEVGAKSIDALIGYCFSRNADSVSAIEMWFSLTADHMESHDFLTGCPVASIAQSTTPEVPEIVEASAKSFETWKRTISRELVARDFVEKKAMELADYCVLLLEGSIVMARISKSKSPLLQASREVKRRFQSEK